MPASDRVISGNSIYLKVQNKGVQYGTHLSSDWGWRDMKGPLVARTTGLGTPTFTTYQGQQEAYRFAVNDRIKHDFHFDHDYVMASDIYVHVHWSHIATTVTGGSVTFTIYFSYAPGHNRGAFSADKTLTITQNASTTQYQHLIGEVQISNNGGDATHLDNSLFEPDGIVQVTTVLTTNNLTVSGGGVPDPFVHFVDIHYLSTLGGTPNKSPDFWA